MRQPTFGAFVTLALFFLAVCLPSCVAATRSISADEVLERDAQVSSSRPPRLFFLFMAEDFMPNLHIWNHFFANASQGVDFEVYLHCKDQQRCLQEHAGSKQNLKLNIIDTVDSEWCADLVSPMNALLASALDNSGGRQVDAGHKRDKFIFLSDTTVPLKSFHFVQKKLTVQDEDRSNFCVQEWPAWAWFKAQNVLAKHSQWVVLNRVHAGKSLLATDRLRPRHMMRQMVPLSFLGVTWFAPEFWKVRNYALSVTHSPVVDLLLSSIMPAVRGCADEYWHMAAAIGALDPKLAKQGVPFDDLNGGPLTMNEEAREDLQGECDTFAIIDYNKEDKSEVNHFLIEGNGTRLGSTWGFLRPHIHAGTFTKLSGQTLSALGSSKFLFARKMDNATQFSGNMTLLEAFDRIIFSKP